jgi:hypothetical protein
MGNGTIFFYGLKFAEVQNSKVSVYSGHGVRNGHNRRLDAPYCCNFKLLDTAGKLYYDRLHSINDIFSIVRS